MNKGKKGMLKRGFMRGQISSILTIALFAILVGISIFSLTYKSKTNTVTLIDNDLRVLVDIFNRIDKDCKILNFDYTQNRINFLNVKSFAGSEVGAVNLAYPEHWQGPYVTDNPNIQGEEYLIVVTSKGYFITPGTGVRLPNDLVVGRDIVLNKEADIEAMIKPGGPLNYNGTPLAAKLNVGANIYEQAIREHYLTLDED